MRHSAFPLTAIIAFLSFGLFGYGIFLHVSEKPLAPAVTAHVKPPAHARQAHPKAAKPVPGSPVADPAFTAMALGGGGLLLSALAALGLARSVRASQFDTAQSFLKEERKAWEKKQAVYDAQRDQLIAELQEAQHKKEEMDSLRQHASRQFQEFFQTLPVACFCFAASGKIIRWNAACEALYGLSASDAMQTTVWEAVVLPEQRAEMDAQVRRVLGGESLLDMERQDRCSDGSLALVRSSMVPLNDAGGAIIGVLSASIGMNAVRQSETQVSVLGAALDDTRSAIEEARCALEEQKAESARLQASLAAASDSAIPAPPPLRDAVTGLWGHRAFHENLRAEIERAVRYHHSLSVLLLDLDGFGIYNKTLGFEAGDLALRNTATLLESKVRTVDVIARLGADEFAVILPETGQVGARMAAERIRSGIAGVGEGPTPLTACLGVTVLSPEMAHSDALVDCLRDALREAKSLGADRVVQYGEETVALTRESKTATLN